MTVVEIGLSKNADRWANVGPFTFEYTVNVRELAFFWTNIFGCPDETSDDTVNILATYIGVERLLRTTTAVKGGGWRGHSPGQVGGNGGGYGGGLGGSAGNNGGNAVANSGGGGGGGGGRDYVPTDGGLGATGYIKIR